MVSIILPKKIERRLKEECERTGVSEEELVLEALSRFLNEPLDPETKVEIHLKLSEKYMRDAEDFLSKRTTSKRPRRPGVLQLRWLRPWLQREE